jgi:prepilin-type processing-associated H-X9-DG protein/prepilin-type N-terminal cleavage/methylation domain-containing protein
MARDRWEEGGFTLVELLVGLAIVAILAVLLLSVVSRVRERADATQCMSNLRQIALANIAHAGDHGGEFVQGTEMSNLKWWHGVRASANAPFDPSLGPLAPYLGSEGRVKKCPAFENVAKSSRQFELGAGGYGYNLAYIGGTQGTFQPERLSNIEALAGVMMFADSALAMRDGLIEYATAEPFQWVRRDLTLYGRPTPSVHFRHSGLANVAWCDGHVSAENPSVLPSQNIYGGDNQAYRIGWFGETEQNGAWNPHR